MSAGSQCKSASDTATVAMSSPVAILARYSRAVESPTPTSTPEASTAVDISGAGNSARPASSITTASSSNP